MKLRFLRFGIFCSFVLPLFFSFLSPVSACACAVPVYYQKETLVESTATTPEQILLWDGKQEHLFIDTMFSGNAKDFGMIIPFPSQPNTTAGTKGQFSSLRSLTAKKIRENKSLSESFRSGLGAGSASPDKGVAVIEQKFVDDYSITTLHVTSSKALSQWLQENKYEYKSYDLENFDYYIKNNKNYFLAIKIRTDAYLSNTTLAQQLYDWMKNTQGTLSEKDFKQKYDAYLKILNIPDTETTLQEVIELFLNSDPSAIEKISITEEIYTSSSYIEDKTPLINALAKIYGITLEKAAYYLDNRELPEESGWGSVSTKKIPNTNSSQGISKEEVEAQVVKMIYHNLGVRLNTDFLERFGPSEKEISEYIKQNKDISSIYLIGTKRYLLFQIQNLKPHIYNTPPLIFSFATDTPFLPFRYMAHHKLPEQLTLYTISTTPLIIPNSEIAYASTIDNAKELSDFKDFDIQGKWLSRMQLNYNTDTIKEDPSFIEWQNPQKIQLYTDEKNKLILTPDITDQTGIAPNTTNIISDAKYRKITASTAITDLQTLTLPYADIGSSYAKNAILNLTEKKIFQGRQSGLFDPKGYLNRAEAAKLLTIAFFQKTDAESSLSRLLQNHPNYHYVYFPDVSTTAWYAPFISLVKEKNIFSGTQQGLFEPSRSITRAEFIKILISTKYPSRVNGATQLPSNIFTDISSNHWVVPYIITALNMKIVEKETLFHPNTFITREEAAFFLWKTMQ